MPMIQLTVPAGALPPGGRDSVQRALAEVLLRWEGAPDTAFFRSLTWSYLDELPEGRRPPPKITRRASAWRSQCRRARSRSPKQVWPVR